MSRAIKQGKKEKGMENQIPPKTSTRNDSTVMLIRKIIKHRQIIKENKL